MKNLAFIGLLAYIVLASMGCKGGKGGGINLFTIEQDRQFGAKLKAEIDGNPAKYPVLPYVGNEKAHNYLYAMRDEILKSDVIKHRSQFLWELHIIKDNTVLNAFCAPGGYIYVYTGLIKYLEQADHLAGVLGHEMAHADQRHSTQSMTEAYGLEALVAVLSGGKSNVLTEMAAGLTNLSFSRAHEKDADAHSVDYLCDTQYASNGAAGFFEKLISKGQAGGTPAFLSTHPNPGNRVQAINERATQLGCKTTPRANSGWAEFRALFP